MCIYDFLFVLVCILVCFLFWGWASSEVAGSGRNDFAQERDWEFKRPCALLVEDRGSSGDGVKMP